MEVSAGATFYLGTNTSEGIKRANEEIKGIADREYLVWDKGQLKHPDFFARIVDFIFNLGVKAVNVSDEPSIKGLLNTKVQQVLETKYKKIEKAKMQKAKEKFLKEFAKTIQGYDRKIKGRIEQLGIPDESKITVQTIELLKLLISIFSNDLKCLKKLLTQAVELNSQENITILEKLIKIVQGLMETYITKIPTIEDPIEHADQIKSIFLKVYAESNRQLCYKTTEDLVKFLLHRIRLDLNEIVKDHQTTEDQLQKEVTVLLIEKRDFHCKNICGKFSEIEIKSLSRYIIDYLNLSPTSPAHITQFMDGAIEILREGGGAKPSDI